jgi:hypothetical protein
MVYEYIHAIHWTALTIIAPPNTKPEIFDFPCPSEKAKYIPVRTVATASRDRARSPVNDSSRLLAALSHGLVCANATQAVRLIKRRYLIEVFFIDNGCPLRCPLCGLCPV